MRYLKALLMLLMLPSLVSAQTAVLGPAANPASPLTVLSQSAIPFIKASTGTMGNNGAVSAMTALSRTYAAGAYLYLPANAISAGSAVGWYWFVASSTTAGTVYNCTYTSGTPVPCTATAFVTTGPGAFTGLTTSVTGPSFTLPANLMGRYGRLSEHMGVSNNNSGNAKTAAMRFGGTSCVSMSASTAVNSQSNCTIQNRGVATGQYVSYDYISSAGGVASGHPAEMAINTAADVTVDFIMQTSTAGTDHVVLEQYSVEIVTKN